MPSSAAPRDDSPWIQGSLAFRRGALEAVEADAVARYQRDEEACGYLAGPSDDGPLCDTHVALENVANKLHALDPEAYFRTARTFFAFNEKRFADAVDAGRAAGRPVKVLYHSHLDAGAYMSPTDQAVLSMGEPPAEEGAVGRLGPGPAWPLAFLVTSVCEGRIAQHGLFVWDDVGRSFVPSTFHVVP